MPRSHPYLAGRRACKFLIPILSFCLFTGTPLFSQSPNASFGNITPANGLPSVSIQSVTQDTFGFIWIGTWDYAYRFDGYTFKKIKGTDGGRVVHADSKGGVWITYSRTVGYYDYNLDSIKTYNIPNADRFADLRTDANNNVWVNSNDGVLRFDTASQLFVKDVGQRPGRTQRLKAWGNGELLFLLWSETKSWLLGRRSTSGTYTYQELPMDLNRPEKEIRFGYNPGDGGEFRFGYNPGDGGFGFQPVDSTGMIFVNRYGWAIKKWNNKDWTYHEASKNEQSDVINDQLLVDGKGNMWLAQISSMSKVNLITGESTVYAHDPTNPRSILPMNSRRFLFLDKQGVLWSTHFGYGISRLNLFESDFGLLKDPANTPVLDVLSALELKDGSFWIGTRDVEDFQKALIHYDASRKEIKSYGSKSYNSPPGKTISNELSNPYAQSLATTSDGSIWVGTGSIGEGRGGLNRIRPGSDIITRFKKDPNDKSSLQAVFIYRLLVDGSDRVWAYSGDGLSIVIPATEEIINKINIQPTDTVGRPYLPEMVTKSGDIIVGGDYKHFMVDHKTLQAKPFASDITSVGSLFFIQQDDKGRIWFRSETGFGYLNSTFTQVERHFEYKKLKISVDNFNQFYSDKNGNIWLTTDNGLIQFNPATGAVKHFGFERGLQGNRFAENYKGPSGKLYYMGTGGVNIFDPENIQTNPYLPKMEFTGLRLDGKSIIFGEKAAIQKPIVVADKITVGPETDAIAIDFAALHFAGSNNNQYQYKLQGFDKDWRDGGAIGNATYTNLPPGDYTLFIKGSNLDNVWSDGSQSIAITILPPWWRTWWAYAGYGLLFLFILWRVHLYQQMITIRRERERTQQRELEQAKEIEKAYKELKSTQAQLIQSEKMASLGELTAGIAHEIQNPLNFVNNFSEVSNELMEEMTEELDKGDIEEAKAISADIKQNLEKINHHGKRASNIVKGMLEHSRTSTGQKEPTDINALCDEYLRLAYHGFKAKDINFNATTETHFDPTLPKIEIIPQDIGRVILNLINNAFYSVNEKSKSSTEGYEPIVTVSTNKLDSKIEIKVKDNGTGIPQKIVDKIFQPFYTTKPTGQGTGLGLSLAYDIVKAHGGELKVETKEGEGSEFIILIPSL